MRLRINDIDHFLDTLEESKQVTVYADAHSGILGPFYHVWYKSGNDIVEIKRNKLFDLLAILTAISDMKKKLRVVTTRSMRRL